MSRGKREPVLLHNILRINGRKICGMFKKKNPKTLAKEYYLKLI